MLVTEKYLERFKVKFETEDDLFAMQPVEVPLHGFEAGATSAINTDIPQEHERASTLGITHRDTNPPDSELWELDNGLRQTFVIPVLDANDVDKVGFIFQGLIHPDDARKWYRNHVNYVEPEDDAAIFEAMQTTLLNQVNGLDLK